MKTITMAVDCGKDETKISILGADGNVIHDKFKTRLEKVTALNNNQFHDSSIKTVEYDGVKYLVGSDNDDVSYSNSKEELVHKVATLTAIGLHVENDDTVNIVIGCPISEFSDSKKRYSYLNYILPPEGNRVEITIDGKKRYFTIGKRSVQAECLCTLFLFPEKYRSGLTGIIDIGGLNVNGSFYSNGHINVNRCFTIKGGKNIVINALRKEFQEKFDGVFTKRDTEVFLDAGVVKGYPESKDMIEEALEAQLSNIKETCKASDWNLATCELVFIGGMANMLKSQIKETFGDNAFVVKNAGFANADGYLQIFAPKVNKE